jgi:phosphatidylinositol glycan class V
LLVIAAVAPGPGYDTSTGLAASPDESGRLPAVLHHILEKLTRWDAIYFVKVADRGYLYEQEWAWGWGFTRAIALGVAGEHDTLL